MGRRRAGRRAPRRGREVPSDRGDAGADRSAADSRFRGDVQPASVSGLTTWRRTEPNFFISAAATTEKDANLTDHIGPHNQDDELFRSAGQADERQLA